MPAKTTPLHSRLRRAIRELFNSALSFFFNRKPTTNTIDPADILRILIIRTNYRIGNLIFLTPFINALGQLIPQAEVDLLVGMKSANILFEPMPNIRKVYDIPRKLLLHPFDMLRFIYLIRRQNYDVIINIAAASSSSQIATVLSKGHYKASFFSTKSWTPLTHVVAQEGKYRHSALQVLEMLGLFGLSDEKVAKVLDLKLDPAEISAGDHALNQLLNQHHIDRSQHHIIGIFRNARFEKRIADEWWQQWSENIQEKDPSVIIVDILSPDIPEKLNQTVLPYSNKNLRKLGSVMAALDGFVCADTGPMHLAFACGATTTALFNHTDMYAYGALGDSNTSIDINGLKVDEVVEKQLAFFESRYG